MRAMLAIAAKLRFAPRGLEFRYDLLTIVVHDFTFH